MASAILGEGFGTVGSVVASVASILGRMQEFARALVEKLVDIAERFVRWFMAMVSERPEDAVLLVLIAAYWLSPYG